MEFKIIKRAYYNDLGEETDPKFYIKKKVKFLGITLWRYVEYIVHGWDYSYKDSINFKTEDAAKSFVKNILCKGIPREKYVEIEIEKFSCDENNNN